jgi:hypothetical protein
MRDIPANQLRIVSESVKDNARWQQIAFARKGHFKNNIDLETNLEEHNQFSEELVLNPLLNEKVSELKELMQPCKPNLGQSIDLTA